GVAFDEDQRPRQTGRAADIHVAFQDVDDLVLVMAVRVDDDVRRVLREKEPGSLRLIVDVLRPGAPLLVGVPFGPGELALVLDPYFAHRWSSWMGVGGREARGASTWCVVRGP